MPSRLEGYGESHAFKELKPMALLSRDRLSDSERRSASSRGLNLGCCILVQVGCTGARSRQLVCRVWTVVLLLPRDPGRALAAFSRTHVQPWRSLCGFAAVHFSSGRRRVVDSLTGSLLRPSTDRVLRQWGDLIFRRELGRGRETAQLGSRTCRQGRRRA